MYKDIDPARGQLALKRGDLTVSIEVDSPADMPGCQPSAGDSGPSAGLARTLNPAYLTATRVINGLTFTVIVRSTDRLSPAALSKMGTAAQILDRITSYGPNPADWTTHVILP